MSSHHAEEHTSGSDTFHTLYERCVEEIKQHLEHTAILSAETFQAAASAVHDHLATSMDGQQDELNDIIKTLVKQWEQVVAHGGRVRRDMHAPDAAEAWAELGVSLLANFAGKVRTFASDVESHLQRELEHHTGTVVGTGNFSCTQCNKTIKKVKIGPLPPCSRCRGTIFRRC